MATMRQVSRRTADSFLHSGGISTSTCRVASLAIRAQHSRNFHSSTQAQLARQNSGTVFRGGNGAFDIPPPTYFQRSSLPVNTIVKFVPQQTAYIVERMGRFDRVLSPGLAILVPIIDRIAYVRSLKETAIEIPSQSAITADNVTLELDGVLYTRIFDPYKAR